MGDGAEGSLWLSIPEGQRATIVVDPLERFAYIDGNLTMRYSGSVAFLAGMVDGFEAADLLSGDLPLRHEATVHVSGVVTDKLADSRLELEGRYAVDGGKLAEWFNVNGEPLALEGGLVISDAGMLGTGVVRSTLMPENVWNSAVQGQVFIPFSTDFRQAYAALNTRVDLPFADLSADGYARVDGALDMVANGSLDAPWRNRVTDSVASSDAAASAGASHLLRVEPRLWKPLKPNQRASWSLANVAAWREPGPPPPAVRRRACRLRDVRPARPPAG